MNTITRHLLFIVSLCVCSVLLGCGQTDTGPSGSGLSDADTPASVDGTQTQDPKATDASSAGAQSKGTQSNMPKMAGMKKMNFPAPADMKFKDDINSNVAPPKNIGELVFTNTDGSQIKMSDYKDKKNVLLVFTEGFNGMLCPFCQTQTSRLVYNYDKFKERNCEIIVVYPGPEEHLEEFVEAALKTEKAQVDKVPFPIALDEDFAATDFFDIHSMLAHPSSYLIDKKGAVQFAYVGSDMTADRPSIKAILQRLDQLQE